MKRSTPRGGSTPRVVTPIVRVLVLSEHEAVRRELVIYLSRSPRLAVSGDIFSCESIVRARPDILVLDLSQLSLTELRQAIDAVERVDASLIALASIHDPAAKRAVADAGGLYRLKSVGADFLADLADIESIARHGAMHQLRKRLSYLRGPGPGAGARTD